MSRMPDGPVKPDENGAAVRGALRAERAPAGDRRRRRRTAGDGSQPALRPFALQWPSQVLRLHHLQSRSDWGAWRLSRKRRQSELRLVESVAHGHRDRSADGPVDCRARWIAAPKRERDGRLLVSGGNMANFVGVLAARTAKAGWDIRKTGIGGSHPRLLLYASSETHTWIQKAADLFGFGTDAIRWIAVDGNQRMKTAELRRQIEADRSRGDRPFLVVGTAGTVSTRCNRPAAGNRIHLPGARSLVPCGRRIWSTCRRGSRRAG